jgi:alditol oxidase
MTRELNWSGNYAFEATRIHRPSTVEEVRRLVAAASRIHAVGSRHSFNGVADSSGELIDLRGIEPGIAIRRGKRTVTVGAGTDYGELASCLHEQGWALANMASLPHITVAGATATGTHGSGDRNGNLSTAVCGLEMVTANGDLLQISRGDPGFDGMVVGLGAFGIITRLTLDIQPSFALQQDAFAGLPWRAVLTGLDAVMSAAYSVSLMTLWSGQTVDRLWLKSLVSDGASRRDCGARLGAMPTPEPLAGASEAVFGLNPFGQPGPWSERLTHFRPDAEPGTQDQIQSEYMVPRSQAMEALARLRAIGARIDRHLLMTEIRSMAGDGLWLSPSYGHDTVALHFTWKKQPQAVADITAEIEEMLLPLGARPHWGKLMHARADRLAPLYPRMADFCALARAHDPSGKFRNAFLDAHVFGEGAKLHQQV